MHVHRLLRLALLLAAACGGDDAGTDDDPADLPAQSCDACDPATQYCHEHIVDAPSTFTCEPFPATCGGAPDCDCIVPEACPDTLQACIEGSDGLFKIECVEG